MNSDSNLQLQRKLNIENKNKNQSNRSGISNLSQVRTQQQQVNQSLNFISNQPASNVFNKTRGSVKTDNEH